MARQSRKKSFEDYPDGARELMRTAERLFGEHGIDGVSLRQIILGSNQANNSAVQHHFGTKMGLVQAIYEMRQVKLDAARARMLQKLTRKQLVSPRDLLDATLRPVLEIFSEADQEAFGMFMLRMTHFAPRKHPATHAPHLNQASNELRARLQKCFSNLPEDAFMVRYRLAFDVFLGGLAERRRLRAAGRFPAARAGQFWDDVIGMTAAMLEAPYPRARRKSR